MKFSAHRVMWVYASGKRVAEFLLRLKNARGRPRPPARNERSTRPFASRTFRCFSVAILEIRSSADMSESETAPRRFRVRRICFFAEEKPASRPPASTSLTPAMDRRWPSNIIYLFVYKMGNSASSLFDAEKIRRGASLLPPHCRSRRRQTAFLLPSDRDRHNEEDDRNDHDNSDCRDEETSERSRRSGQLQVGLDVGRHGRVVDNRGATEEAQAGQEGKSHEGLTSLADCRNADARDDLTVNRDARAVDGTVADPEEPADARPVAAEVDVGTLQPTGEEVSPRRVVCGLRAGRRGELRGARLTHPGEGAALEPGVHDCRRDQVPHDDTELQENPTGSGRVVLCRVRPTLDVLVPLQVVVERLPADDQVVQPRDVRDDDSAANLTDRDLPLRDGRVVHLGEGRVQVEREPDEGQSSYDT